VAQLLRKEWKVFWFRGPLFLFGVYVLASLQTLFVDEAFFLLNVALAGGLAFYVPVIEWYQESDKMLHSLPVSRSAVVITRYVIAVMAGGIAGLAWSATGRFLLPFLDAQRATPAMWMTLEGVLTFILSTGLLFALFLPLYFRLGMGKGALGFLALSLILLGTGYGTRGLATGSGGPGTLPFPAPSGLIRMRISALLGGMGVAGTLTTILLGTALLLGLSLRLSQRWYERREF
jgi:hypothetical protein